MKVWKDKEGKKLTVKEFTKRFKDGIVNMTPEQRLKNEARSTFIMLIGYLIGLVSLVIYRKSFVVQWFTYALIIIFLGASWGQFVKWFTSRQQLRLLKNMGENALDLDKILGELSNKKEENNYNSISRKNERR